PQAPADCTFLFQKYHNLLVNRTQFKDAFAILCNQRLFWPGSKPESARKLKKTMEPPMTSVLTPVLPENAPLTQPPGTDITGSQALHKQDTREYLADMLRELSAIAAWADLNR